MEIAIFKLDLPSEKPFFINEDFIYKKLEIDKAKYDFVKFHFSDNFIFIEFKIKKSPVKPTGFIKK